MTSIVIPSSVTSIGRSAFSGCSSLTSVVFDGDCPPEISEIFELFEPLMGISNVSRKILGSIKFIVPKGAKGAYIDAGYPTDKITEDSEI